MTDLVREVGRRRTFAIISHPDAGKTTLTEKLLLFSGAILLAGGRGTRLDGVDKPLLMIDGDSLLNRTIDAAAAMEGVRPITIVGPDRPGAFTPEDSPAPLQRVREDPPYGGPAAAVIAAADTALRRT